ncbi:MAG: hypothetical protein A2600_09500 [Candidatus Lambdaproteobacteria bacterium RIFOXYD1_FULL_56_27]|uniref:Cytochrome C n=1 Tax=Candidatus Lambdaproteobacteria bacterium RIFOXYD2_FULL_56_26 TaxID=1817773 RepID=A0A1F6GUY0_9PROT|nr:MAG: hypothetical protein A2557_04770 [Candidatus Lambdaproteobacteria bacterium RIFOXYD2_FULL_56_26]OGH02283.1 MAG: hypothetical protein A2426_03250 [Candidatus Lambdaproteobacteria bacterium RIFOXYC1_FULL_56_13]OGH10053.1 MAG: hypothetical protein A2600_09500 [Candidatus Lambdaproteobacteria bacterium RIFOXYD1_FULL_56_27]
MKPLLLFFLLLPILAVPTVQGANLELSQMMTGLGANTYSLGEALEAGDLSRAQVMAERIVNHPQAGPAVLKVVKATLGKEMGSFKGFDDRTHLAGEALIEAAKKGDLPSAQAAFGNLAAGCAGCHQAFRAKVAAALAEAP